MDFLESDSMPSWLKLRHVAARQIIISVAIMLGMLLSIHVAVGQPPDSTQRRTDSTRWYSFSTTRIGMVYSLHLFDVGELNERLTAVGYPAIPSYASDPGPNYGFECGYIGKNGFGVGISYHNLFTASYAGSNRNARETRLTGGQFRLEGTYSVILTSGYGIITLVPKMGVGISQIDISGRAFNILPSSFDLASAFDNDSSFALHQKPLQLHIGVGADLTTHQYDSSGMNPVMGLRAGATIPLTNRNWNLNGAVVDDGPAVRVPNFSISLFVGFDIW